MMRGPGARRRAGHETATSRKEGGSVGMIAALDGGDVALIVLSAFWGLLVLFLCIVLINTFRVLESTKMLIDVMREETVPLLREVKGSLERTNRELDRVDVLLEATGEIVGRVRRISGLVEEVVSSPLVKLISLGVGVRKATSRFGGKGKGGKKGTACGRLFWVGLGLGVGAASAILASRFVRRQTAKVAPATLAREARGSMLDLAKLVSESVSEGKAAMQEKRRRAALGAPLPRRRPHDARPRRSSPRPRRTARVRTSSAGTRLDCAAMDGDRIREAFLRFFEERGHKRVPSSSLIPQPESGLLLTNAGMNQFIPYFLGHARPPFPRAVTVQKVFRAVDIDIVGHTARHLTMFEMLGNFSFGDYFKAESCRWGYELVTEVYGIEPDRLWVTVFRTDDEAIGIWRDIGMSAERIVRRERGGQLLVDARRRARRTVLGDLRGPRARRTGPRADPRSTRSASSRSGTTSSCRTRSTIACRSLRELPARTSTPAPALERLAVVLQGVAHAFETDLLRPLARGGRVALGASVAETTSATTSRSR